MNTSAVPVRRIDRGTIAVLELDSPDRSMNVVDESLLSAVSDQLAAALADSAVEAIVLASAKPSFGAGADVGWLPELAARDDAESFIEGVHELMLTLVRSTKPVVAAVNGMALGGAFELALGARELVAGESAIVGLPEVTLGLLPGGGGTQLLLRFVSAATAAELLTTGRQVAAQQALSLGLVHEVVPDVQLLERAVARAQALVHEGVEVPDPAARGTVADVAVQRQALIAGRTGLGLAAARILDVLEVGVAQGIEPGLYAERQAFLELLRSADARAAIHLFAVDAQVKRRSGGRSEKTTRLGVVGGGQMGAGVAATAVTRGIAAVVRDVNEAAIDRARAYMDRVVERKGVDHARGDWSGTTAWGDLAGVDAVVEAVFELPELKRDILGSLSSIVDSTTLVATNTSAIPISLLASSVEHPERFIGMHFFSPVERMPLVEIITHAGTSEATAQRAAGLGRQLGKVPITVGDRPGFFTSRVYARWLMEGIRLLLDGASVADVDAAAKRAGFPVGPLQAHDEATLDLVLKASIDQVAKKVMTGRLDVETISRALTTLVESGVKGRRHGLGFYRYDDDGRRTGPNDDVLELLGVDSVELSPDDMRDRLLLAFASECFLCWDDGTLCHPDDGDIASVLGIGFPRMLGGPFHWADEVGAGEVLALSGRLGEEAFPAGVTLRALADEGRTFAAQDRRPGPLPVQSP